MDNLVSLALMIGVVLFYSIKYNIVPDWFWAPYPRLVLDGVEELVDGEPQQSELMFYLEGLEWAWREDQERLSLKIGCPRF